MMGERAIKWMDGWMDGGGHVDAVRYIYIKHDRIDYYLFTLSHEFISSHLNSSYFMI